MSGLDVIPVREAGVLFPIRVHEGHFELAPVRHASVPLAASVASDSRNLPTSAAPVFTPLPFSTDHFIDPTSIMPTSLSPIMKFPAFASPW